MSFSSISAFFDQLEFITGWLFILLPLPFLVRLFIKPAAKQEIALLAPTIMQRFTTGNQPKIEANVNSITYLSFT